MTPIALCAWCRKPIPLFGDCYAMGGAIYHSACPPPPARTAPAVGTGLKRPS